MRYCSQKISTTQQTPWVQQMIRSKQIVDLIDKTPKYNLPLISEVEKKFWMDRCTDMDFDYPYPMIRKKARVEDLRDEVEDLSDELDFDDPDDEIKETYNKFLDNPMEIL